MTLYNFDQYTALSIYGRNIADTVLKTINQSLYHITCCNVNVDFYFFHDGPVDMLYKR